MFRKDMSYGPVITLVMLAIGSGIAGGFIHHAVSQTVLAQPEPPRIIRATGVELVDSGGRRVGYLGASENGSTSLAFFDALGKKRAEFGMGTGNSPRLDINDQNGGSVLSLDLGQQSKPRLMMSDHDFNDRVYLGVAEPDAPSPNWKYDSWVLRFTGDRTRPLAIIGMTTGSAGGVAVFDQAGHSWRTPLK